MAFEWRCGGGGPDDAKCDACFPETGDKSGYVAAREHGRKSKHRIAGLFEDGALRHPGLKGGVFAAQNLGAIERTAPTGPKWPRPAPSPNVPRPDGVHEPEDDDARSRRRGPERSEEPEDDAEDDDDELGDDDDDEGDDGDDDDEDGDAAQARATPPQAPRGRRPTMSGAYRAWTPYPVLMLNELIGLYFRAWVKVNLPNLTDAAGEETDEAFFARPVGEVMGDWIVDCIQQHQRDHSEQYGMAELMEEARMKSLDERQRNLEEREAELRRSKARVAADRLEVLKLGQQLLIQKAEDDAAAAEASAGGR